MPIKISNRISNRKGYGHKLNYTPIKNDYPIEKLIENDVNSCFLIPYKRRDIIQVRNALIYSAKKRKLKIKTLSTKNGMMVWRITKERKS